MRTTLTVSIAYYSWLSRKRCKRDIYNEYLTQHKRKIYYESKRIYGSPRIALALINQGIRVSRNRVARITKKEKLRSIIRKKLVVTTNSKHNFPLVGNLFGRDFNLRDTGEVWFSNITNVWTSQRWLYLTVILNLGDHKAMLCSLGRLLRAIDKPYQH